MENRTSRTSICLIEVLTEGNGKWLKYKIMAENFLDFKEFLKENSLESLKKHTLGSQKTNHMAKN